MSILCLRWEDITQHTVTQIFICLRWEDITQHTDVTRIWDIIYMPEMRYDSSAYSSPDMRYNLYAWDKRWLFLSIQYHHGDMIESTSTLASIRPDDKTLKVRYMDLEAQRLSYHYKDYVTPSLRCLKVNVTQCDEELALLWAEYPAGRQNYEESPSHLELFKEY